MLRNERLVVVVVVVVVVAIAIGAPPLDSWARERQYQRQPRGAGPPSQDQGSHRFKVAADGGVSEGCTNTGWVGSPYQCKQALVFRRC